MLKENQKILNKIKSDLEEMINNMIHTRDAELEIIRYLSNFIYKHQLTISFETHHDRGKRHFEILIYNLFNNERENIFLSYKW